MFSIFNKYLYTVPLILIFGAEVMPHPDKLKKGGEDSYFIDKPSNSFGIADGVGGWANKKVDPALFSRQLMEYCRLKCVESREKNIPIDPIDVLTTAWKKTDEIGSSTALVATLNKNNVLSYVNLGDSGLIILRLVDKNNNIPYSILYRTIEQQHRFNCPYQLSSEKTRQLYKSSISDNPSKADKNLINIQNNDIIIAATDGIFDNLFDTDIVEIVNTISKTKFAVNQTEFASKIARTLIERSVLIGRDPNATTPFSENYYNSLKNKENTALFKGGKLDDCTAVVAIATEVIKQPKL